MKKIISLFAIAIFILIGSENLFAQNSPKYMSTNDGMYMNSIKMNLMNAAFSYPTFCIERRLNDHLGVQLDGVFRMGTNANTASTSLSNTNKSVSSIGLYPSLRYYFYQNKNMRFENYLSVFYKYRSFQSVNDLSDSYSSNGIDYSVTYSESTNGAGLLLGLQSGMDSHFVFDMYFGTQVQSSNGSWLFHDKNATLSGFKQNFTLSQVSDPFSFLNSSSLRAGFTVGVRF